MFWENYRSLCENAQKSPSAVAKELGFSSAASTHWKNGKSPNMKTVQMIADYFGVPVSAVVGDDPEPAEKAGKIEESAPTPNDPIIDDVMEYARAMVQTDSGRKKLADIARFMRQSVELEDLGRKIFNG